MILPVILAERDEMSGVSTIGDSFRSLVFLVCFVIGMVPGLWAAWRELKALTYYLRLKGDEENVAC